MARLMAARWLWTTPSPRVKVASVEAEVVAAASVVEVVAEEAVVALAVLVVVVVVVEEDEEDLAEVDAEADAVVSEVRD